MDINKIYKKSELTGIKIPSYNIIDGLFEHTNGRNMLYTTVSGLPCKFNVCDIDSEKVVFSADIDGVNNIWRHISDKKGNVYAVSADAFIKYDTLKGVMKRYDISELNGEILCFDSCIDDDGNIYTGTFPHGNIIKFNPLKEKFEFFARPDKGAAYIRGIAVSGDWIYCGSKGDSGSFFYRINKYNPTMIEKLIPPEMKDYFSNETLSWYYTCDIAGDKIFVHTKTTKGNVLLVVNTKSGQFENHPFRGSYDSFFLSDEIDGKKYFFSDNEIFYVDCHTYEIKNSGIKMPDGAEGNFLGVAEQNGEKCLAFTDKKGGGYIADIKSGEISHFDLKLCPANYLVQSVEAGSFENGDCGVYFGGYCGDAAVRYDTDSGKCGLIHIEQIEGMTSCRGRMYFGVYPHNRLYEYDYNKENLTFIGEMCTGQDRPFAMETDGVNIYMGTIPFYGLRGGAVCVYNTYDKSRKCFENIVGEQSITSLKYMDGLLYGGTTVWGGLAAKPCEDDAFVFVLDPTDGKILNKFVPEALEDKHPTWIGQIAVDLNNNLWGVSGKTLFMFDGKTGKTIKSIELGEYNYSRSVHRWRPKYIRFDKNGILYVNINGITAVDIKTLEYENIIDKETELFAIDKSGNVYYTLDSEVYVIKRNSEGKL